MSILSTSSTSICVFDVKIAAEFKDIDSAVAINYLLNLSLPLPEKTLFTPEEIALVLTWTSKRAIKKVISNLEQKKILERSPNSDGLVLSAENLLQFVQTMGEQES